ncbi:MAG: VCBS repeat-containing protein [Isosphaeraceae bacterium]
MEPKTLLRDGAQFTLPAERTSLVAADLDGDRRDELVYGTAEGRVFAIHSGPGRHDVRNPHLVTARSSELWLGGHAVVTAGDLDGDGRLDLIAGVSTGRLYQYAEVEKGRYQSPSQVEAGGAPFVLDPGPDGMLDGPVQPRLGYACPTLVDWTGHDRLDLVVGGAGGEVLVLPNDGAANDPRFGSPVPLRCRALPLLTPPRVRPGAADWNGDGQIDLIALNLQGFLCVYPRIGRYEVDAPVPMVDRLGRCLRLDGGFGLSGRCALWAGTWTGSGQADILVGLPRANRHVVPAVTGLDFADPNAIPTVLLLENLGHGVLCPRPIYRADGSPLVLGSEGCSPSGVITGDSEDLDLLVGLDDGSVSLIRRDELRW